MKKNKSFLNRKKTVILLLGITFTLFIIFGGRFTYIMAKEEVNGQDLKQHVDNLYSNNSILQSRRGGIYDRHGETIAVDATSYKLIAVLTDKWSTSEAPQHVVDKEKTASVLSRYIPMSEEKIFKILNQPNVDQVEFGAAGNQLTFDSKNKIEKKKLPGIKFEEQPNRFYPNGVFASHIIGMVDESKEEGSNELTGLSGVESTLDDILAGEDGRIEYQTDLFGYAIPGEDAKAKEAKNGKDVHLTLDKSLQVYLESVASEVHEQTPSKAVTATLMEAETGKILAATQRPTYNATTKENIDETWQNFHTEYTFEPGSTLKVMTLAAAINEGVFHPYDTFLSGSYRVADTVINDHKPQGWGVISYLEGLAVSSNVGSVKLAEAMGTDTWHHYLNAFGFGQATGVPLPNENAGSNPYDNIVQAATTSFGQGLTVTPMQMLQAFSAVANDGKMMQPQLIEKIVDPETGEEQMTEPKVTGQPISETAAKDTLKYLNEATYNENSTTRGYHIDGYDMAVKTGTSQIADPESGGYLTGANNYVFSAVGMAPADDPQYILYVTVQQPELNEEVSYGGTVVQNIFKPIMKWALDRSTAGDVATNVEAAEMPKVTQMPTREAYDTLINAGLEVAVIGTGDSIVQQYPYAKMPFISGQKVAIMTSGAMSMPDLTGWSKNDALKISELTGIPFNFDGEGYIVSQSVVPGTNLSDTEEVSFKLAPEASDAHSEITEVE